MPRKLPEEILAGTVFGRLTVLGFSHVEEKAGRLYKCSCMCGSERFATSCKLKRGEVKSCGCLRKDVCAATSVRWRQKSTEAKRMKEGDEARGTLFRDYVCRCRYAKRDFNLSKEDFINLVAQPCVYCGDQKSNCKKSQHGNGDFRYTGLDRVDSKLGYVYGNVVPCCKICNYAKRAMTKEEFLSWVDRIYKHQNSNIVVDEKPTVV